jgi:hypothetical protein
MIKSNQRNLFKNRCHGKVFKPELDQYLTSSPEFIEYKARYLNNYFLYPKLCAKGESQETINALNEIFYKGE